MRAVLPPCPCPQNSALARGCLVEKGHTKRLLVRFTVLRVGRMTGLLIIARVNIPLAIMIVRSRPYSILYIHPSMIPFFESLEPTTCGGTIRRYPCSLQRPVPLDFAISRSLIASHLHEHRVDGATSPLNEANHG